MLAQCVDCHVDLKLFSSRILLQNYLEFALLENKDLHNNKGTIKLSITVIKLIMLGIKFLVVKRIVSDIDHTVSK